MSLNLQQVKIFHKLYDRIKMIDVILRIRHYDGKKMITISFKDLKWEFPYTLEQRGITLC